MNTSILRNKVRFLKTQLLLTFVFSVLHLVSVAQTTAYWQGNVDSKWAEKRNWSTNAVPDANTHVIIGPGPFTNQPATIENNSNEKNKAECLSLTIGGGSQEVTLINENINGLHIATDLNILSNGRLHNQKSNLYIKGNWTNNGRYTEDVVFQNNNWVYLAEVHFTGTNQTISGSSETKFGVLRLKSQVSLNCDLKIQAANYNFGILEVHPGAVLDPTNKKVYWSEVNGTSNGIFDLQNGATAKVKALNYLDNYSIRPTLGYGQSAVTYTSTIDYAGTINQNIDNLITYQKLVISGSGVKSLTGNTSVADGAADTEVNVKQATLDLGIYTLKRVTAGGSFIVASGAAVKIGGSTDILGGVPTNTPVNFNNRQFDANSNVEYYGANQDVQHNTYGHLLLSNTGAKTMPPSAMTIQGNLTSTGTVQYAAAAALTVGGNINIGPGTTFSGGSFTHTIAGNWVNNGTFTPGTGTIAFNGSTNTTITGVASFNGLTIDKTATSNTVTLNNNAITNTLNMTSGELHTSTNSLYLLGSRSGNGWVVGTVTRQHAFTSGIGYAFNGPYAILTFTGASGINEVTMRSGMTGFTPTGFTTGKAINRMYEIVIPAGTYTSANLQLQYRDSELNGCEEDGLKLYSSTTGTGTWKSASRNASNTTDNWVARNTLSSITGFWTLTDNPSTYRWDGTVSTAWENGANWEVITDNESTRGVSGPISSDLVILGTNTPVRQPTISQGEWVKDISFMAPNKITLSMSGGSLKTTSNLGAVAGGTGIQHELNAGSQTINIGGNLILNDGNAGNSISLSSISGTINVTGNITHQNTGSITLGTGNLNIGGNYTYTAGNFTPGTSTVTYNGTAAQTVGSVPYNNLSINKASGTATFTAATAQTISGNLTIGAGTMALNVPTLNIAKDIVFNGGTLQGNASTIDLKGNWTSTGGTFTPGTSTVIFSGTTDQLVPAITFHNLSKTTTNKLTTTGNSTLTGNLSILSGTLVLNGHTLNRSTSGGMFTLADGATLQIVNSTSAYPQNFSTNTLGINSTVIYDAGNLTIEPVTYGYLSVQGPQSKSLKGNTRVANNMTVGVQGTVGNPGAVYTLTLDKDLTNSNNINAANVNLTFTNTAAKLMGTGTTTVRDVTVASGAALTVSKNLTLHGNLTNNGNGFTAASNWVDFTGTTAATITSGNTITINELRVNKTPAATTVLLAGDINGLQIINVAAGTLDAANRILTKKAAPGTILTVTNAATMKIAGTNSLPLFDSYTLQPTSTVVYNGSNQTIKSVQYGHLDLINIGTATFEAGTALIAGNLTEGTETTVITPATINYNGTGAQIVASLDYNNLTLSTSGLKTFAAGDTRIAETFTLAGTATANARTNITNIHYTKTGNQNVLPLNYNSLTLNGSGTKAFSGTTSINSAFTLAGTANADLLTAENTIVFDGGTQTVPALNYKNLSITAAGVKTLAGTIQVEKALTLTAGELATGTANKVILGSTNGSISETGTASGYLRGILETERTLTSGASQSFGGIGITITPTTGTPGLTKVTRVTGTTVGSAQKSILRNFSVAPLGTNTNLNATVTLTYQQHELNGLEEADLIMYTSWTGGDDWKSQNSSAPVNKTVTLGSVQSMAHYTLGGRNTPLPVELVYFKATKKGADAVLEWKTASEKNNEGFEIEASADGQTYQKIGSVKSLVGTSSLAQNYTYTDNRNGKNGMVYYRLRQVDMDGTFKYYGPKTVNFGTVTKTTITAYPNPFASEVNVAIETASEGKALLTLYTTTGKKLMQQQEQLLKGSSVLHLKMNESLPRGLYLLTIEQNGKAETLKLLKN